METACTLDRRRFLGRALGASAACAAAARRPWGQPAAAAEPDQPAGWRIGCFTRPWDRLDYREALDAIAEAGYRHAGLMTCKREKGNLVISPATDEEEAAGIGEEVRRRGMSVPSVYGGDFAVRQSLAAGIAGLKKLIDNCAAARSESLMLGGTGDEKLFDDYYKAVAECCDYAVEKQVALVLKPHGGLNATGPQCREIVRRVGHRAFSLWYDPGNIFWYSDGKLDPVEDAPSVAGAVTGMCVKDFRMTEPAEGDKPIKEVMITPGTGQVDFPRVLAALREGGFRSGPVVVECLARDGVESIVAEARQARRRLEQWLG
jgi:sugar phosphate isomerase/epimerase